MSSPFFHTFFTFITSTLSTTTTMQELEFVLCVCFFSQFFCPVNIIIIKNGWRKIWDKKGDAAAAVAFSQPHSSTLDSYWITAPLEGGRSSRRGHRLKGPLSDVAIFVFFCGMESHKFSSFLLLDDSFGIASIWSPFNFFDVFVVFKLKILGVFCCVNCQTFVDDSIVWFFAPNLPGTNPF